VSFQQFAQGLASPKEAGHHRPHRNANHVGNLSVRQTFQFAQHQHFPETHRQVPHGLLEQRAVIALEQQGFRIRIFPYASMYFFIEDGGKLLRAVLLQPSKYVLRTIVSSQARALPPRNVPKY
jgi:hypothetical protein